MTLGEKIRDARLEAGLSQRQLCGERITRNMLSQIEHGTARPSMDTLEYLAHRLGKHIGYFLDEESEALPNLAVIRRGRECWSRGDAMGVCRALADYRGPDAVFDREKALLEAMACMEMASAALAEGRRPYALELLATADGALAAGYEIPALRRRWQILMVQAGGGENALPDAAALDEELLLRAELALDSDAQRAKALLEAVADRKQAAFLLGRAELALGNYPQAAAQFHRVEKDPKTAQFLEVCYREMGDFEKAYYYACQQRKNGENS